MKNRVREEAIHIANMQYRQLYPLEQPFPLKYPPSHPRKMGANIAEVDYYEGTIEINGEKFELRSVIRTMKRIAIMWGTITALRYSSYRRWANAVERYGRRAR